MATTTETAIANLDVESASESAPAPSWNIAPTQQISVLVDTKRRVGNADEPPVLRRLEPAIWGLIPAGSPDPNTAAQLYNAPLERVTDTPLLSQLVASRRAAIPASGYYEWRTSPSGAAEPYFVFFPDDELFVFAGLYEWWRRPGTAETDPQRWVLSATILTRPSAGPLAELHERMPVFLEPGLLEDWLDPFATGTTELVREIGAAAADLAEETSHHRVADLVNDVTRNSSDLVQPL